MQLRVKGQNLFLPPAVVERVDRRMRFALGRFANRIERVSVRLADLNGPRAGVDKQCQIAVKLRSGRQLLVEGPGADLETAIDCAADRIQRSVARAIERMREARTVATLLPPRSTS